MNATRTLPPAYTQSATLDLSSDRRAVIALNVAAVALLVVFGALTLGFILTTRGGAGVGFTGNGVMVTLTLLALYVVMILLHEAIHGFCFWWVTRARPAFGISWRYAYAAAPDWYIPRNAYLVVALAPAVVITLGGLLLIAVVPAPAVMPIAFVVIVNGAGAVGDFLVTIWLLRRPPHTLVNDVGDAMTLYAPTA